MALDPGYSPSTSSDETSDVIKPTVSEQLDSVIQKLSSLETENKQLRDMFEKKELLNTERYNHIVKLITEYRTVSPLWTTQFGGHSVTQSEQLTSIMDQEPNPRCEQDLTILNTTEEPMTVDIPFNGFLGGVNILPLLSAKYNTFYFCDFDIDNTGSGIYFQHSSQTTSLLNNVQLFNKIKNWHNKLNTVEKTKITTYVLCHRGKTQEWMTSLEKFVDWCSLKLKLN
ncbi:hypothetical protein [Flavobacterium sp.]|jgi:hypothetical protein|uniref:hypothetical protein n=1 Tax=Flavobacterium sp. TaxID=239 RepID=UPI0037C15095